MIPQRLLAAAALFALACGSTEPQTANVSVRDNVFAPNTSAITVGSTVIWTWDASNQNAHDLTWDAVGVPGVEATTTGTYERTFNIPGTYQYYCVIHQAEGMTGSVTVE